VAEDLANGIVAENEVPGANIGSISIRRLVVAMHAAKTIHPLAAMSML
jgi:hypothetical protein